MPFTCPVSPAALGCGMAAPSSGGKPRRGDSCPVLHGCVTPALRVSLTVPVPELFWWLPRSAQLPAAPPAAHHTPPFSWRGDLHTRNTSPYCTALEPSEQPAHGERQWRERQWREGLAQHPGCLSIPKDFSWDPSPHTAGLGLSPSLCQEKTNNGLKAGSSWGEQSSANVLRAGWGYWDCSTSQTLPPKRLKKYL